MDEKHGLLLEDYRVYLEFKNYKPRGIEGKMRSARYFFEYIENNGIDIKSFTRFDGEFYRENMAVSLNENGVLRFAPETINGNIAELRLLFKFLISVGEALKNPFCEVEKMRGVYRLPKNILTIEEMGRLLSNIAVTTLDDLKFKTVVEVLYSTGARITEIENLERGDIDLDRGLIKIIDDKDRRDRIAPLTEYSVELLKIYLDSNSSNEIFRHGKERSLNRFINDRLKRLTEKLELPLLTCHGIRHAIATHLLKKGADLREVQEFLGHRRIKNTEIYTRLANEDLKKAIDEMHPREKGNV